MKKRKLTAITLLLIIILGAFFRFYNLNWGENSFFHPDESNIARSVAQLSWPKLHPHFFAYGHFSIYLAYFLNQLLNLIKNQGFLEKIAFPQAIYTLRLLSAVESTLLIPLIFLVTKKIFNSPLALLASTLVSFTPGLIQTAHFGTVESLLTLTLFATLFFSLKLTERRPSPKVFWLLAITLSIGLSTKINSLIFFGLPFLALILRPKSSSSKANKIVFFFLFLSFLFAFLFSFLTSPYQILNFAEFHRIAEYEINLAQGKIPVFYTRQFISTKPVIFQLIRIFPLTLGPTLEISGLIGFFLTLFSLIKKEEKIAIKKKKILLLSSFLIYFPLSLFTFTKWTRFTIPLLPFFSIFSVQFCNQAKIKAFSKFLASFLIISSFSFALAFLSIYTHPDVRITASDWMAKNLPPQSKLFSQGGNVVDIPLKGNFKTTNFDFYDLEGNPDLFEKLIIELTEADYILIPSRRIFASHPQDQYPVTACYHQLLFSGQLGFEKIKEFTSYPSLKIGNWKLEIPDEAGEETWSVFDHPVIRLYKKKAFYSQEEYRQLFRHCLDKTEPTTKTKLESSR